MRLRIEFARLPLSRLASRKRMAGDAMRLLLGANGEQNVRTSTGTTKK
jgi:hypothetical protein